jgi:ribose transport system permease protein
VSQGVGMSSPEAASSGGQPEHSAQVASDHARDRDRWVRLLEAASLPLLTILLALFFTLLPATSETFPTTANLRVVAITESVLVIVAMAALIPLIFNEYDFSVGAVCGLSAILTSSIVSGGQPLLVAVLAGVACGLGIGLVNGLLVTIVRVDSVVVTLGMTTIVAGLVSWKTSGQSVVSGIPDSLTAVSNTWLLGIPGAAFIAIGMSAFVYYLLAHTPYGRYLHAMGANRAAARLLGVRTTSLALTGFLLAGTLAGAAGVLQVGVSGAGNPQVGPNFTLPAIAAAFLSVAAIKPGRFNVWGTLTAIVFLAILNTGLNLAGANPYVNDFANGGALIVGVSLAAVLGRHRDPERA